MNDDEIWALIQQYLYDTLTSGQDPLGDAQTSGMETIGGMETIPPVLQGHGLRPNALTVPYYFRPIPGNDGLIQYEDGSVAGQSPASAEIGTGGPETAYWYTPPPAPVGAPDSRVPPRLYGEPFAQPAIDQLQAGLVNHMNPFGIRTTPVPVPMTHPSIGYSNQGTPFSGGIFVPQFDVEQDAKPTTEDKRRKQTRKQTAPAASNANAVRNDYQPQYVEYRNPVVYQPRQAVAQLVAAPAGAAIAHKLF